MFILTVQSAQASAQAVEHTTAEQVIARSRKEFPSVDELDCPRKTGEIVICGRRNDPRHRLPLPVEPAPGAIGPDDRFTTDRLMNLNGDQACTSNTGCARATIPLARVGPSPPGSPDPVVDIIADAARKILVAD